MGYSQSVKNNQGEALSEMEQWTDLSIDYPPFERSLNS